MITYIVIAALGIVIAVFLVIAWVATQWTRVPRNHVVVMDNGRVYQAGEWVHSFSKVLAHDISERVDRIQTPAGDVIVRWKPDVSNIHAFEVVGEDLGVLRKLTDILAVNPHSELTSYQSAFGILVNTGRPLPNAEMHADVVVVPARGDNFIISYNSSIRTDDFRQALAGRLKQILAATNDPTLWKLKSYEHALEVEITNLSVFNQQAVDDLAAVISKCDKATMFEPAMNAYLEKNKDRLGPEGIRAVKAIFERARMNFMAAD